MAKKRNQQPPAAAKPSALEQWRDRTAEFLQLLARWRIRRQLFGHRGAFALLVRKAPTFCGFIREATYTDLVVTISRLVDPATTGGKHDNASFEQLLAALAPSGPARSRYQALYKEVVQAERLIRIHRNKFVGHQALDQPDLDDISVAEVDAFFEAGARLLDMAARDLDQVDGVKAALDDSPRFVRTETEEIVRALSKAEAADRLLGEGDNLDAHLFNTAWKKTANEAGVP